jgi:hypothetical protein
VAVVEDDASAAPVVGEPVCAAVVTIEAVLVGFGDGLVAEAGQGAVGGWRQGGWSPAVVVDPVSDRVFGNLGKAGSARSQAWKLRLRQLSRSS